MANCVGTPLIKAVLARSRTTTTVLALVVTVFFALPPSRALADQKVIFGVPFVVEELSTVDANSSKIQIGGNGVILPNSSVDEHIVRSTFGTNSAQLSVEQLKTFITNATQGGKPTLALLAFPALNKTVSEQEMQQFLSSLAEKKLAPPLGAAILATAAAPAEGTAGNSYYQVFLVFNAGIGDPELLRARAVSFVVKNSATFKQIALEDFKRAIANSQPEEAESILKLIETVFGLEDQFSHRLRAIWVRASQIITDINAGQLERVMPMLHGDSTDSDDAVDFLAPLVNQAIYSKVEQQINEGSCESALILLARVDFTKRSDRTHELLLSALRGLTPSDRSPLLHQPVNDFIAKVGEKDERVRVDYLTALERQAIYLLTAGNFLDVESLIRRIVSIRADPDKLNDRIRLELAFAWVRTGRETEAAAVMNRVSTGIPISFKMRFLAYRIWNNPLVLILVLLIPMLVLAVARGAQIRTRLAELARAKEVARKIMEDEDSEPEGPTPQGFAMLRKRTAMSPSQQEYLKLLAIFGLDGSADLPKIKRAYRAAVKECHPDLGGERGVLASQRFIDLTKHYERLLELRKAQGLDG